MSLHVWRAGLIASFGIAFPTASARAQCADGSPPPCRTVTAAAAPRRVNPPLDDRTWIVVPFDNLRQNQEIDWLRAASVNLLYLDMSRWRDIRVIDDERVADLMREVPEVRDPQKLDLNAGLAVAKRAGARNLVMGDLLMLGSRTAVTAKVYDVRSGQRVRSVQEATTVQDSVMPLFSKLAQKVLNVAPPEGVRLGTVGTTSVAAYQAYLRGVQALNAFNLSEARQGLSAALQRDSTFALAHFKLAILIGWENPSDSALRLHMEAAGRLATGLPARERGLINGNVLQSRRDFGGACDAFSTLLRADSTDVEAWYGFGDCRFHDNVAEPTNGDTTRIRFRGDLNESIRAFKRALALDPTYHLAYQHIVDAFMSEGRGGRYCVENRCTAYASVPIRSGDTLIFVPVAMPRDTAKFAAQRREYVRTGTRSRNVVSALAVAEQWVNTSPEEHRARASYAITLLAAGRIREAETQFDRVRYDGPSIGAFTTALLRLDTKAKLWRPEVVRLYDSLRTSGAVLRGGSVTASLGSWVAFHGPLFGRLTESDSMLRSTARSPAMQRRNLLYWRVLLGLAPDSVVQVERATFDEMAAQPAQATASIMPTLAFGLRIPRVAWPPLDTTVKIPMLKPAIALARADTSSLRAAARELDSLTASYVQAAMPDTGMTMVAADAFLILRDSASALRMTRRMLDSVLAHANLSPRLSAFPYVLVVPRAMLLRADLAAALGHRDEAKLWYTRFIDLWSTAVPELQPIVERARKSLAALGS